MMRQAFIFIFLFSSGLACAQSLYNASVIAISPTGVMYVKDSITNNGTIVNNGDMQVGGSWINNAQYDAGLGQITFNSDVPQIINHNDQSFSRLTISGGGQKLFLADITIVNQLDLSEGTLVSENNARIIFAPDALVSGASDQSHIQGPVYHQGPGDKLFPLGNGTTYLPVELLNIQGPAPEVGIRSFESDNMTLQAGPSLNAVSTDRYWVIDVVAGSLGNALAVLPVRDETIAGNVDEIVVAQSADPAQDFENLGRSDFQGVSSDGRVTSEKFVTQPYLAVGKASPDGALVVYNAVSANNDGQNDFLVIGNIEYYPENKFSLFNRWGDKLFEIENYDNKERVFRGKTNIGGEKDLVNGTYFYVIETKRDGLKVSGFLALKN